MARMNTHSVSVTSSNFFYASPVNRTHSCFGSELRREISARDRRAGFRDPACTGGICDSGNSHGPRWSESLCGAVCGRAHGCCYRRPGNNAASGLCGRSSPGDSAGNRSRRTRSVWSQRPGLRTSPRKRTICARETVRSSRQRRVRSHAERDRAYLA